MTTVNYKASYTARQFHKDNHFVRGLRGPVGCGKTVACVMELFFMIIKQEPNEKGIRPTRFGCIRNTYAELENTTIKTFKQWIPEELCYWVDSKYMVYIKVPLPDGTIAESEVRFLALDKPSDEGKIRSWEISGFFANECSELPWGVIDAAMERCGRFPSLVADGVACSVKKAILDTNSPPESHWWYSLAELKKAPGDEFQKNAEDIDSIYKFFDYPGGLLYDSGVYVPNPKAENIKYLPGGYNYYLDMVKAKSQDRIKVMVLNQYGKLRSGMPVYNQFNENFHVSKSDLGYVPGYPVAVGWDWGRDCAAVFGQLMPSGQLRIFAELVGIGTHIRQFVRDVVKPFIDRNLYDAEWAFSFGDPSGVSEKGESGLSYFDILNDEYLEMDGAIYEPLELPFVTECAPTNNIDSRIDAVEQFISRIVKNGEPGYLVSSRCKMLIEGKIGGYCYKRLNVSGDKYADKPDKNEYSHPADAEQYLALGFISQYGIMHNDYNNYSLPKPRPNNSMGY